MAITRTTYITVEELNSALNGSYSDDSATQLKIAEASELLEYHMQNMNDYDTSTAPNNLKLATAYQVEYNDENIGIDYSYSTGSSSVSVGRTSESYSSGEKGSTEYKKIAPKARKYLLLGGLVERRMCG